MARKTSQAADNTADSSDVVAAVDRLTEEVRLVSEHLNEDDTGLAEAVLSLQDEIHTLRISIDELRDDVVWAVRNALASTPNAPFQLTSMPCDPTAADFGAGVNKLRPSDLPPELLPAGYQPAGEPASAGPVVTVAEDDPPVQMSDNPPSTLSVRQFNIDVEQAPAIPYCCVKPELEWVGEHDDPSIVCAYCGETVAVLHDGPMMRPGSQGIEEPHPATAEPITPDPVETDLAPQTAAAETAGESTDEGSEYCCTSPQLTWRGDAEAPAIICASCGYLVAEYGEVLDERASRPDGFQSKGPSERQGQLWSDDESA